MSMTYADLAASADARAWAGQAAQTAYYQALAQGQTQDMALKRAQFEWQKQLDTANQTGMWNGQWNNPQEQWFTGQFGQWFGPGGAPSVGQQTLGAQQQGFAQSGALSGMFGQYYAPGTAPIQGMTTADQQQQAVQNAQSAAQLTGYYKAPVDTRADPSGFFYADPAQKQQYLNAAGGDNTLAAQRWAADVSNAIKQAYDAAGGQGTQTLAGQQQQWSQGFQQQQFQAQQAQLAQQNTQNYLQLLSNLRGPADWAKYQQVLGSTPQGMRDLYAAAMGQYIPGAGATTGVQPQAVDLGTMQQQVAGYNPQAQQSGGQVWGSGIGVGQNQQTGAQAVQATGNGTNMYGGQQQQYNLPAPNQISPQAWNNFTPSQQQNLLGQYEAQGWDKGDVQALYNQSLPKYGSNNATAGTWRLQ